jgi:MFS family permease
VIGAYMLFTAASLACALSMTLLQLTIFRAIQGIAGSALYALNMVIVPEITPREWMTGMTGVIGIITATAGICGPVLGGIITQKSSWRWIFYLK